MKKIALIAILVFAFASAPVYAQETEKVPEKKNEFNSSYLGIGLGLPYG